MSMTYKGKASDGSLIFDDGTGNNVYMPANGGMGGARKYGPQDPRVDPRSTQAQANQGQGGLTTVNPSPNVSDSSPSMRSMQIAPESTNYTGASGQLTASTLGTTSTAAGFTPNAGGALGAAGGLAGLATLRGSSAIGTGAGVTQGALSGAALGAGVGSMVPGIGTLAGAGIGAAGGALVGSGAGKTPWGVAGEAALAIPTGGLSFLGSLFGGQSNSKQEAAKIDALKGTGMQLPDTVGQYWNENFLKSGNVSDLQSSGVKNATDFYSTIPNYSSWTPQEQLNNAQAAMNTGAITEGHGTINVNYSNPGYSQYVNQMVASKQNPQQTTTTTGPNPAAMAQASSLLSNAGSMADPSKYANPNAFNMSMIKNPYLQ